MSFDFALAVFWGLGFLFFSGAWGVGGVFSIRSNVSSRLLRGFGMAYLRLPNDLLVAIGKFATCWAVIEQDLILTTSALAAQDTGGKPLEHLRMDFKRLREKWFALTREKRGESKELTHLNMELADASRERGFMLHGIWHADSATQFKVYWFEQIGGKGLSSYEEHLSLTEVISLADALETLCNRLSVFTSGA